MPRPSEDDLIARFFAPLATYPGAVGLTEDAALISPPPGTSLVVTADALVASVHFFPDDPPDDIARKALRVNLSDLAAKGAKPRGYLRSLALPEDWQVEWLEGFSRGLAADGEAYRIPLLGGDTLRTPGPLTIAVTAIGTVPGAAIPRRNGARPGDLLFVSGTIGDGALGLIVRLGRAAWTGRITTESAAHLLRRYRRPEPRLALAPAVLAHASAAMDVSDGLVGDIAKLVRASGAGAEVAIQDIPLSSAARDAVAIEPSLLDRAITGGDDYEVVAAVSPAEAQAFEAMAAAEGVAVTRIGMVTAGEGPPRLIMRDGGILRLERGSFSHF
jgi:thiamine-monophosphate kinase